jgi:hypothetical protein
MVTEVFLTFITTSLIGMILAISAVCYKSKCSEVNFCGLKIIRNVEIEDRIDELTINTPRNNINDNNV